eukprot:SAG25_NODE_230_length_11432_cov_34.362481_7_plen_98_part_00
MAVTVVSVSLIFWCMLARHWHWARQHDASFGQLFEKVTAGQSGETPVQSRWGTEVVGMKPPAGFPEEKLGHGGLPATGWGAVRRNGNGLVVAVEPKK